jgi:hypothetical protein
MNLEPSRLRKVSSSARKSFDSLPLKTRSRQAFCRAELAASWVKNAPLLRLATANRQIVKGTCENPLTLEANKRRK